MVRDPHAVLGVDQAATEDEIRAAFRRRSMLVHPDLHQGRSETLRREAERAMAQLTEAYEALIPSVARGPGAGTAGVGGSGVVRHLGRILGRAQTAARPAYRLGRVVGRRKSG